jgi:hypothetical protein
MKWPSAGYIINSTFRPAERYIVREFEYPIIFREVAEDDQRDFSLAFLFEFLTCDGKGA